MIEIEKLQEAVAKHGSFRAAAKALGLDESTVRKRLKGLTQRGSLDGLLEMLSWATPRQIEIIETIEKCGTIKLAADALGMNAGTITASMDALRRCAARQGHSPEHHMTRTVPDGFLTKGVSSYFNRDGKLAGQWVKSKIDPDRQREMLVEAANAAAETLPRLEPIPAPASSLDALCNLYTFTDYHLGMLAWKKETGADWDLKIAERLLVAAFSHMIDSAPAAGTAFIAQLGDFLHSDGSGGMLPITPGHGNILDQDGRFSKIVGVAIRVLRRIVDFALARHGKVIVLMAEGNHDIASSVWLRALFRAIYEDEPRVQIIDSEVPYYAYEHGTNMLGFHHGHLKKKEQMPLLFAAKFPEMWGRTTKRVIHTGHMHHKDEKEHNGVTVVQHRTIAANDSHSARHGYVSERSAQVITYHREFGEVARNIVVPEMFEAV